MNSETAASEVSNVFIGMLGLDNGSFDAACRELFKSESKLESGPAAFPGHVRIPGFDVWPRVR
jgi:hypothetical protein